MADKSEELEKRIQWLTDRAEISELVAEYTQCVDDANYAGWQSLFTDDGCYITPTERIPKPALAESAAQLLRGYSGTQHFLGQHSISIDGDNARGRCYFIAAHVIGDGHPSVKADVAGWYLHTYRRTDAGWRFVKVGGHVAWTAGEAYFAQE
jgi:hypothetical protein